MVAASPAASRHLGELAASACSDVTRCPFGSAPDESQCLICPTIPHPRGSDRSEQEDRS
jgi:hypothetical protein